MSKIHSTALLGYKDVANTYDNGRPGYPDEAINFIKKNFEISEPKCILDLGAGTGKFTQYFVNSGANVVAVEPVPGMLASLLEKFPDVIGLNGTAELIPVGDGSVDIVICAQAFHWFNATKAGAEIFRILKAGGYIVMVWNRCDESYCWVKSLTEIINPFSSDTPQFQTSDWKIPFKEGTRFSSLKSKEFAHSHLGDSNMVLDRVLSTSFIAKLPDREKNRIKKKVDELISITPDLQGAQVKFPYKTELFWCQKPTWA